MQARSRCFGEQAFGIAVLRCEPYPRPEQPYIHRLFLLMPAIAVKFGAQNAPPQSDAVRGQRFDV